MRIETQGISQDYATATGEFEPIDRGVVTREELRAIWDNVMRLPTTSDPDKCPPSINIQLVEGYFSCFTPDNGQVICLDTNTETLTVDEAIQLMSGEVTIKDFDAAKGYPHKSYKTMPFYLMFAGIGAMLIYLFVNGA